jgi:hypothetical protein
MIPSLTSFSSEDPQDFNIRYRAYTFMAAKDRPIQLISKITDSPPADTGHEYETPELLIFSSLGADMSTPPPLDWDH